MKAEVSTNVRHAAHNKATHPLEGIAWLNGNDHLKGRWFHNRARQNQNLVV